MNNHEFLLKKADFATYFFGFFNEILVEVNKDIHIGDTVILIESELEDECKEDRRLYYNIEFVDREYKVKSGQNVYRYGLKRMRKRIEHRQRLIDKLASQAN